MSNGIISFDESKMDEASLLLQRNSDEIKDVADNTASSFASIKSTGLFDNGICSLQSKVGGLSDDIGSVKRIITNHSDEMKYARTKLKEQADSIEIPLDFSINDSAQIVSQSNLSLSKKDGKAINPNNNIEVSNLDFKNSLSYNDKLKKIIKEYESTNHEIEISSVDKETLKNIKKDNAQGEQSIDEFENLENINIEKMNETLTTEEEYDDNYSVREKLILNQSKSTMGDKMQTLISEFTNSFGGFTEDFSALVGNYSGNKENGDEDESEN